MGTSSIGVIGDTHGRPETVILGLRLLLEEGVTKVVQVGDFGFWPGKLGEAYLNDVSQALSEFDQELFVVPGNHEDYTQIRNFQEGEDGWLMARSRIKVAPRGFRWLWDDVSFVALGGAPSVDRTWRLQGQRMQGTPLWWKEEAITDEDVAKTVEGGYADVMFTHDAPLGVPTIEKRIAPNPNGFYEADLQYALEGREKMLAAVTGVLPQKLFHGHYHFLVNDFIDIDGVRVRIHGMSSDGQYGTYGTLDLDTLNFHLLG